MNEWALHVREPDGGPGRQIADFQQFDAIARNRLPGSWSIRLPADGLAARDLAQKRAGIVLSRDDLNEKKIFTGYVTSFEPQWSREENTMIVSGVSDLGRIWNLACVPYRPGFPYQFPLGDYAVKTGKAEAVIKGYVRDNCQRAARPITVAPNSVPLKGTDVVGRGRFQSLGEICEEMAISGGGLSFDLVDGVFDVYESRDLTRSQVFTRETGNIESFTGKVEAPKATRVYVAGKGEGADRIIESVFGESSWGEVVEVFIDARDTEDINELRQKGEKAILDAAEQASIEVRAIDRPGRRLGVNWDINDSVTAEGVSAVINSYKISLDGNGETITPTVDNVNSANAQSVLALFDEMRRARLDINALQRNL